jgi:hypothetical protein
LEAPDIAAGAEIAGIPLDIRDIPTDAYCSRYAVQDPPSECLQTNSAHLSDQSFKIIPILSREIEGWFDDNIIDMSFDLLSRILGLPSHCIAISNVASASDLFKIGHWTAAEKQHTDLKRAFELYPQTFDNAMLSASSHKDFIVFPINDGYPMGIVNNPDARAWTTLLKNCNYENGDPPGSHWTVMVIDCRRIPRKDWSQGIRGFHFDSTCHAKSRKDRNQDCCNVRAHGAGADVEAGSRGWESGSAG